MRSARFATKLKEYQELTTTLNFNRPKWMSSCGAYLMQGVKTN